MGGEPIEVETSDKENEIGATALEAAEIDIVLPTEEIEEFGQLEDEILELLGANILHGSPEFKFHPELAKQWTYVLTKGLEKETKRELLDIYPRKGNCPIATPKLNLEIESTVNETVKRRDKYFVMDQELCGASLSSLGKAINMLLCNDKSGIEKTEFLKTLIDSGKLMCELFNQLTKARKAFIYPGLDKKARQLLENAPTNDFLFGTELSQRIRTAKEVEKVGLGLKSQVPEKKVFARPLLNWRGPPVKTANQSQVGYKRRIHFGTSQQMIRQGKIRPFNRQPRDRPPMHSYNYTTSKH